MVHYTCVNPWNTGKSSRFTVPPPRTKLCRACVPTCVPLLSASLVTPGWWGNKSEFTLCLSSMVLSSFLCPVCTGSYGYHQKFTINFFSVFFLHLFILISDGTSEILGWFSWEFLFLIFMYILLVCSSSTKINALLWVMTVRYFNLFSVFRLRFLTFERFFHDCYLQLLW